MVDLWTVRWAITDDMRVKYIEILNPCDQVEDVVTVRELETHPKPHELMRERIAQSQNKRRVRRFTAWLNGDERLCP